MPVRKLEITLALLATGGVCYTACLSFSSFQAQADKVARVLAGPTLLQLELEATYLPREPLARTLRAESWTIVNRNGVSREQFEAKSAARAVHLATPERPSLQSAEAYDLLVAAHFWELRDDPFPCDTLRHTCYRVHVRVARSGQTHERELRFSDQALLPHAQEYRIILDEHRSAISQLPALLTLSNQHGHAVDYQQIITAFRQGGEASFVRAVDDVEADFRAPQ